MTRLGRSNLLNFHVFRANRDLLRLMHLCLCACDVYFLLEHETFLHNENFFQNGDNQRVPNITRFRRGSDDLVDWNPLHTDIFPQKRFVHRFFMFRNPLGQPDAPGHDGSLADRKRLGDDRHDDGFRIRQGRNRPILGKFCSDMRRGLPNPPS